MAFFSSKLFGYAVASTGLASAVVLNAYNTRGGFYAAAVAIGRSNGSVMVLLNFAVFLIVLQGILLQKIFFGSLRTVEIEHLYERSWYFLTETMLALTVFRDNFDIPFLSMFGLLLFLKCFHWISIDRVDYMDQVPPPGPPRLFHARMISILSVLFLVDLAALRFCGMEVIAMMSDRHRGGGATLLFASEFAVLMASNAAIVAKYILNVIDIRRAGGDLDAPAWEDKSMFVFYVDLAYDAVRLAIYSTFFYVIFALYGTLPINQIHSLFSVVRSFLAKLRDLARYKSATRNMDQRYPDATTEEIERLGGGSCVICREEMVSGSGRGPQANTRAPNDTPKKLACGHVFHFHCLRSWLERQQSCPTCRRSVLSTDPPAHGGTAAPQPGQAPHLPGGAAATGIAPNANPAGGPMHPALNIWNNHFLHPATVAAYPRLNALQPGNHPTPFPARPPMPGRPSSGATDGAHSPATAVTPISSQAPSVFSSISARPADRATESSQEMTPAQVAAAAAMRRLQKLADAPAELSPATSPALTSQPPAFPDPTPTHTGISFLAPISDHVVPPPAPSFIPQDTPKPFLSALDSLLSGLRTKRAEGGRDELQTQLDALAEIEGKLEDALEQVIVERSVLIAGDEWD